MDLLNAYAESASDEEEEVAPLVKESITKKFELNDPRRKSTLLTKIKEEKAYFNSKLFDNWNKGWNINLHGTNMPTASGKTTATVQLLLEEAQKHTQEVSEGSKRSTPSNQKLFSD
jgi:hypothetical protein